MKMIRWMALGLALATSLALAACGTRPETFTGSDGSTVVATNEWKQFTDSSDIKAMFDTEDSDISAVTLALGKLGGRRGLFFVEEIFPEEMLSSSMAFLNEFANRPQELDAIRAELSGYELSEREIELLLPLIKTGQLTEEEQRYLDQELLLQSSIYRYKQQADFDFKEISLEDATIAGLPVQVLEYSYTNAVGASITQLDAYCALEGRYFLLSVWTGSEDYARYSKDYRALISSFKP